MPISNIQKSLAFDSPVLAVMRWWIYGKDLRCVRGPALFLQPNSWTRFKSGRIVPPLLQRKERWSPLYQAMKSTCVLLFHSQGDRVGICSRNCPDYLVSFWACRTCHILTSIITVLRPERSHWRRACAYKRVRWWPFARGKPAEFFSW